MRVLLVDHDSDSMMLTRKLLWDAGFEVEEAGTAVDALKALSNMRIDAIVTDLVMPDMDGLELIGGLKEDPYTARLPIVVCSTAADRRRVTEAIKLGAHHFLVKPIEGELLIEKLREAIDRAPPSLPAQIDAAAALRGLGDDKQLIKQIVDELHENMREVLAGFYPAVSNSEAAKLDVLGARLETAAGAVGANSIVQAASGVVHSGTNRDFAAAVKHLSYLESMLTELEKYSDELGGGRRTGEGGPSAVAADGDDEEPLAFF